LPNEHPQILFGKEVIGSIRFPSPVPTTLFTACRKHRVFRVSISKTGEFSALESVPSVRSVAKNLDEFGTEWTSLTVTSLIEKKLLDGGHLMYGHQPSNRPVLFRLILDVLVRRSQHLTRKYV
jgi:hypothetical protein